MVRDYQPSDLEHILKIWLQSNLQAHDFIDLDALIRLQFIAGHGRSLAHVGHGYAHAEVPENLLQMQGRLMENPVGVFILCVLHLI